MVRPSREYNAGRRHGDPDLPHLPVEFALLLTQLGLPGPNFFFGCRPIEKTVDRLHEKPSSEDKGKAEEWRG